MNVPQAIIEHAVDYAVDWEATGTWFGGFVTAAAVFIAARLVEGSNSRAERREEARRLGALAALYGEVLALVKQMKDSAGDDPHGVGAAPPDLDYVTDLLATLIAIPALDLPSRESVTGLFDVRRVLVGLAQFSEVDGEETWAPKTLDAWCGRATQTVETATASLTESDYAVIESRSPWRPRLGRKRLQM
jgi:hypothetical protein